MASRKDDRPGVDDSTRIERAVPNVAPIDDEDSAAETEVFIAGKDSATRLVTAPAARAREVSSETVREARPGRVPPAAGQAAGPPPAPPGAAPASVPKS